MYKGTFYDRNLQQKFQVSVRITDYGFEVFNNSYITKINRTEVYAIDQKDQRTLILKIGQDFPFSVLEVSDYQFFETITRSFKHITIKKDQGSRGYLVILASLVIGIGLLIAAFLYFTPILGEYLALKLPKEAEIKMGQGYYDSYKSTFKIDTAKTRIANEILSTLDYGKVYPLEITVVDDQIKNAFALPGGHIVVYDKIIQDMGSAEEFAALIAHESAHVNRRHATKSWGRSAGTSMIMYWMFGDFSALSKISHEFLRASYSRELESEADRVGVETLVDNKVSPHGMVWLLENLQKEEAKEPYSIKYLRSHPMSVDRISLIETHIKGQKYDFPKHEALQVLWEKLRKL